MMMVIMDPTELCYNTAAIITKMILNAAAWVRSALSPASRSLTKGC